MIFKKGLSLGPNLKVRRTDKFNNPIGREDLTQKVKLLCYEDEALTTTFSTLSSDVFHTMSSFIILNGAECLQVVWTILLDP